MIGIDPSSGLWLILCHIVMTGCGLILQRCKTAAQLRLCHSRILLPGLDMIDLTIGILQPVLVRFASFLGHDP
jgi:hypothetical protein